jgi:hypothetical protein
MTTDTNRYYNQDDYNFNNDNQSYVDQYEQEKVGDENFEEEQLLNQDQNYLDNEFTNALERDEDENLDTNYDEEDWDEDDDLEEDDLDDDLVEDYDENDREIDSFSDDGYKID